MSFDRLAPYYRAMEWSMAGGKLQRGRLAWLGEVAECRRVLIVGEGTGRFIAKCAVALPGAEILCVDASAAMLARAQRALRRVEPPAARADFQRAALPDWSPPRKAFDLIVTHFFLDCFPAEQLETVVTRLASGARPGAKWLLADFCMPPRGLGRLRARLILALAYAFFRAATKLPARRLVPPDAFLERHGFRLHSREIYDYGLLHSDLWVS